MTATSGTGTSGTGTPGSRESARTQPGRRLFETGDLPPMVRDPSQPVARKRKKFKPLSFGIKTAAFVVIVYFFVLPLIPGFRNAATELLHVRPDLLFAGLALQIGAWWAYSMLTMAALGDAGQDISKMRMFRIQMSTKALSNIVPGGSAAGSALAYRLMTLSGVRGADAGFALATAGLGSAVVLNLLFWSALTVSIPVRGVNRLYASAALAGVVVMLVAAGLVIGLVHGQGRAERILKWIARKFRFDGDRAAAALRQVGTRVEELIDDRQLLKRVVFWTIVNWVLDAMSLWVFLRAFGGSLAPDALFVAFGLANVMAVIPFTPGGLGIVEGVYIPTLVGFNLRRSVATLGVAAYRITQLFLPIAVGAFFYATLRIGPWSIERRDRLERMRQLAHDAESGGESRVDFLMRVWPKRVVRSMSRVDVTPEEAAEQERAEAIDAIEHPEDHGR